MRSGVDLSCLDSEVGSGDHGHWRALHTGAASSGGLRALTGGQLSATIELWKRTCRMRRLATDVTNQPSLR